MKLAEIEIEALALNEGDRAALIGKLIETLPGPSYVVTDEEVLRRDAELESGAVKELNEDELVRRVQQARRG